MTTVEVEGAYDCAARLADTVVGEIVSLTPHATQARLTVEDLEKLGFELQTCGKTFGEWCNEVWSSETDANRQTIFDLVQIARECRHPIYSLALIWVFEATGIVFIGHTRKAAIALGMDEELKYFGREHYEEEFGHSVVAHDYAGIEIEDELHGRICDRIDRLFQSYQRLFNCWHEHRDRYAYARPIRREANKFTPVV
jgi:hypothetical protein